MSRVDVSVGKNKKEEEGKKWIEEDKGRQLTAKKTFSDTYAHTHPPSPHIHTTRHGKKAVASRCSYTHILTI